LLGTGEADADGVVTIEADLPADLEAGDHTLGLLSSDGTIGFSQAITVSTDASTSDLPYTGSESASLFALAVALLCIGALGTYAAKRQTRPAN
jgi:LPXTG-motif cell wall-anchored protein